MRERTFQRRGIALIWTAIFLLVLLGFLGLATDKAWIVLTSHQLEATADASALAGARLVKTDQDAARQAAVDMAAANRAAGAPVLLGTNAGNLSTGDVVLGQWDLQTHAFTVTTANPNAVKVVARRTSGSLSGNLPLFFGPVFGASYADVQKSSIAMLGGGGQAGLLILDPSASCALDLGGNGTLNVSGGDIQVNSGDPCAACSGGGSIINTPSFNIHGANCFGNNSTVNGNLNIHAPVMVDPLANLPEPPPGPIRPSIDPQDTITISPGKYADGIKRTGGVLTCQPGIYYLTGTGNNPNGFEVTGGDIYAHNCMFFMKRGLVKIGGGGNIDITPPDSGTYQHVSFFQARNNFASDVINGSSTIHITGTLYFPNNHVDLNGGGDSFGVQIIAWTLKTGGNGTINLYYDGYFPGPPTRVYLVQ